MADNGEPAPAGKFARFLEDRLVERSKRGE
jgi:hypothetical protein